MHEPVPRKGDAHVSGSKQVNSEQQDLVLTLLCPPLILPHFFPFLHQFLNLYSVFVSLLFHHSLTPPLFLLCFLPALFCTENNCDG